MDNSYTRCCWKSQIGFDVSLWQRGPDDFGVRYGKQWRPNLTYAQAAKELGQCLMHAMACESMLDNRTQEEAEADGD